MKTKKKICSIYLGDRELQFTLQRTDRKTIGISIDKTGLVKVTGPHGVPDSYINELLHKKSKWILKKLAQLEKSAAGPERTKSFKEGESFAYLGQAYGLKLERAPAAEKSSVRLEGEELVLSCKGAPEAGKLRDILKLWYVERFKQVIENRLRLYSEIIGVFPCKVTIREQKTRWGSCSSKGNINLNWKLIMAPQEVLDYVVIHELCHMKEMNHSDRFWAEVEKVCPQYKRCRRWLRENGNTLSIE